MKVEGAGTVRTLKIAALVALLFGAYVLTHKLDLGEVLQPDRIVAHLRDAGPFAPLLFMLLMATAVVISPIPSLPLDLAAGAAFGTILGAAYAVIGAEIGAILSFLLGRFLGREAMRRIFRMDITFCEHCSDRHLALLVFLSRLLPVFSFDLVSYGAGLTNMSLKAFATATLLGMMLPTLVLTSLGGRLVLGEWSLILFGAALVALLLVLPKLIVRYSSSRWISLFRGGLPAPDSGPVVPKSVPQAPCSSCREAMPISVTQRRLH